MADSGTSFHEVHGLHCLHKKKSVAAKVATISEITILAGDRMYPYQQILLEGPNPFLGSKQAYSEVLDCYFAFGNARDKNSILFLTDKENVHNTPMITSHLPMPKFGDKGAIQF